MSRYDAVVVALSEAASVHPLSHPHSSFLLPIGGETFLSHAVRRLINEGVNLPIHVLVDVSHANDVDNYLQAQFHKVPQGTVSPSIYRIHQVSLEGSDEVSALLSIKSFIHCDFLLIKPILLLSDLSLHSCFEAFVFHDASAMVATCKRVLIKEDKEDRHTTMLTGMAKLGKPDSRKNSSEYDRSASSNFPFLGIEGIHLNQDIKQGNAQRIAYWGSADQEVNSFHPAFLLAYPELLLTLSMEILPCMFLKNQAFDLLQKARDVHGSSFKSAFSQFLPFMVGAQNDNIIKNRLSFSSELSDGCVGSSKWWHFVKSVTHQPTEDGGSGKSTLPTSLFKKSFIHADDNHHCFCYAISEELSQSILSAHNIGSYVSCVDSLRKNHQHHTSHSRQPQILEGNDLSHVHECLVGSSLQLNGIGTIKQCTIGANVIIGDKCRIINSIIMDNVRIGDGCKITDSIICGDSTISTNTTLTDCIVNYCCTLQTGTYKHEVLKAGDAHVD
ncbi:eukaryotic initiation factor [Perkinsela sp. CCAP 1560/4]|nr:eukaryotic initiation factor [Perkinsela sp. CCAP 1560/4]|eukprot:KNH07612.1 eukaryotic initiation factor [Perkinsela sp. CCAP 1560/4]